MEPLRRALATIGQALNKLTRTQVLLVCTVAVCLVMVLFIVSLYTSKREMVALMPGQPADQQARALQFVQDKGVDHDQQNGEIMVPRGMRPVILAQMADSGSMPTDSKVLFDNLIEKQSWTLSQRQNQQLEIVAVQNELANIIGKMNGIRSARVILNLPEKRSLGQTALQPSAIATVFPAKALDQNTVDAIAHLVAGSRGIDIAHVRVIDGSSNRQFSAGDDSVMSASTYLEYVSAVEMRKQRQLQDMLASYIPGVIVSVHAQVDVTRRRTEKKSILPEGKGSATLLTSEQSKTRQDMQAVDGGEPGPRSNTRADISGGGGGGAGSSENTSDSQFQAEFGRETLIVEDPRGNPTKVNAVVNIPRPYFVSVWRSTQAAPADGTAPATEPTEDQLKTVIESETARIKRDVELQIDTSAGIETQRGEVQVSMIPSLPEMASTGAIAPASIMGLPTGTLALDDAIKTLGLGGMALIALGMLVVTALKAGKRERLPSAQELVGVPPALAGEADVIGEAVEADSVLQGIELSDEEMKSRKMMEQVEDMVKEKPEDAARLLGRWITGT